MASDLNGNDPFDHLDLRLRLATETDIPYLLALRIESMAPHFDAAGLL